MPNRILKLLEFYKILVNPHTSNFKGDIIYESPKCTIYWVLVNTKNHFLTCIINAPKMSTKGFGGIPDFKLFGKGLFEKFKLDIANFK